MTTEIHIEPYNPKNKYYFDLERTRIKKKLGKNFEIHHIGSTAVPGLGGKRTIDILVLAKTKKEAKKIIKPLEIFGYEFKENAGDKYRNIFQYKSPIQNKNNTYAYTFDVENIQ